MSPMKSILWKEVRQQGSWFLMMLLVALVGLACVFFALGGPGYQPWPVARETLNLIAIVGFGLSIILALALSSIAFASEKENRTHQNLFLIPASLRQLVMGKVLVASGFVVAYLVFIVAGLLLLSLFNNIRTGQGENLFLPAWIRQAPLWSAEFFIWGLFFSLIVSRPIVAAVLAGIAAPLAGLLMSSTEWPYDFSPLKASWMPDDKIWLNDQLAIGSVWLRGTVVFLIALASLWIAKHWLPSNGKTRRPDLSRTWLPELPARERDSHRLPFLRRVTGIGAGYGRFLWLGLRTCWPLLLLWSILAIAVIIGALSSRELWLLLATLPILGGLAGTLAFTPDRSREGQAFLGVRAENPAAFWLTRTVIWAGWLALVMTLVALFLFREHPLKGMGISPLHMQPDDDYRFGRTNWSGFSLVFSGGLGISFCAGLFCSILMGSRILAAGAAIAASIPLLAWYLLMLAGGVPHWLGVVPGVVLLLACSLIGTHSWFAGRLGLKQAFLLAASLLAALAATGWLTIRYRANEIPECGIPLAAIPVEHHQLPDLARLSQVISRLEEIKDRVPAIDYDIPWRNSDVKPALENWETSQARLELVDDVILLELLNDQTIKRGATNVVPHASRFGAAYRLRRIPGDNSKRESAGALARDFDLSGVMDVEALIAQVDKNLDSNGNWLDEFREELENLQDSMHEIEEIISIALQDPGSQTAQTAKSLVTRMYDLSAYYWEPKSSALRHLLWQSYLRSLRDREHEEAWAALRMWVVWKSTGGFQQHYWYGSDFHWFACDLWLHFANPNPDQLKESIRFLEQFDKLPNYQSASWIGEYRTGMKVLDQAEWRRPAGLVDRLSNILISLIPSERERAKRLYNWFFANAVAGPMRVAALEFPEAAEYYQTHLAGLHSRFDPSIIGRLSRATMFPDAYFDRAVRSKTVADYYQSKAELHFAARARAELGQIYLAICGWQKKYGKLPDSLEVLAPEFLAIVPTLDFTVYGRGGGVEPKWVMVHNSDSASRGDVEDPTTMSKRTVVRLNKRHPYARKLESYHGGPYELRLEFESD